MTYSDQWDVIEVILFAHWRKRDHKELSQIILAEAEFNQPPQLTHQLSVDAQRSAKPSPDQQNSPAEQQIHE